MPVDERLPACPWCGRRKAVVGCGYNFLCTHCKRLFDKDSRRDVAAKPAERLK